MPEKEQCRTMQIGNIELHITARFHGTLELQYLIRRLIQKEMEQEYC